MTVAVFLEPLMSSLGYTSTARTSPPRRSEKIALSLSFSKKVTPTGKIFLLITASCRSGWVPCGTHPAANFRAPGREDTTLMGMPKTHPCWQRRKWPTP